MRKRLSGWRQTISSRIVAYGRLCAETGKIDRALQELQTAVKLAPGSPDARFALSRALWKAGRKSEAEREQPSSSV